MFKIRNEQPADYAAVEEVTRKAFYNMYIPGCVEHYLVHIIGGMRTLSRNGFRGGVGWTDHREYHVHQGKAGG